MIYWSGSVILPLRSAALIWSRVVAAWEVRVVGIEVGVGDVLSGTASAGGRMEGRSGGDMRAGTRAV
jgi:hypothetical protein